MSSSSDKNTQADTLKHYTLGINDNLKDKLDRTFPKHTEQVKDILKHFERDAKQAGEQLVKHSNKLQECSSKAQAKTLKITTQLQDPSSIGGLWQIAKDTRKELNKMVNDHVENAHKQLNQLEKLNEQRKRNQETFDSTEELGAFARKTADFDKRVQLEEGQEPGQQPQPGEQHNPQ